MQYLLVDCAILTIIILCAVIFRLCKMHQLLCVLWGNQRDLPNPFLFALVKGYGSIIAPLVTKSKSIIIFIFSACYGFVSIRIQYSDQRTFVKGQPQGLILSFLPSQVPVIVEKKFNWTFNLISSACLF